MTSLVGTPLIELRDVYLSYHSRRNSFDDGNHRVLNGISLTLHRGETLGIIGRNGSGKSTILRLLAGIIGPNSGEVIRSEYNSSALLTIGLGFKPNLSGRDNAVLSAMLQGSTRSQAEALLDDIKEFSELDDSFEEPVKTYSSGMRSRLGFSTALMTHVDIMLIDEVLSVVDAHFKQKAEAAICKKITSDQTVVFVSHSDAQISSLCDRAVWINEGNIAAQGNTDETVSKYQEHIRTISEKL